MHEIIIEKLLELEHQQNIKILYACESGSRAWGFPSPDSDFDVRFIYARKEDDYLTIAEIKDTIELPVNEILDIGGWDLKKALKLFLKSNSPLYEWLQSPIVYLSVNDFTQEIEQLMPRYFSLKSGAHHYFSMAQNTLDNDLQRDEVKLKRYFYALRSTLACKWIIEDQTLPPMEFGKLRVLIEEVNLQLNIDTLLRVKSISDEKTLITPIKDLDIWLKNTIFYCKDKIAKLPANHQKTDELNLMFRKHICQ